MKMRFPIQDLMSEETCYERLLEILHPDGLCCPEGHALPEGQAPHNRDRAPVNKYRCRRCGCVFDLFTGTVWAGTHYNCVTIQLVMRGFVQGTPMNAMPTIPFPRLDGFMPPFVIHDENGRGMMMGMRGPIGRARFTPTRWKASGLAYVTFSVLFAAFINAISLNTSLSLNRHTISNSLPIPFFASL